MKDILPQASKNDQGTRCVQNLINVSCVVCGVWCSLCVVLVFLIFNISMLISLHYPIVVILLSISLFHTSFIHIPSPYPSQYPLSISLSISPIHIPLNIPYPYPSQCISLVIINPCPVPISPLLELPRARHGGHDHLQPGATHDGALRRQQRQPRDQQVSGHQTRRALLLTLRTHHRQLYDCAPPRLS